MLYGVKCRKRLSSHGAVNKGDNLGCINTVSTDCELSASLNCNENEKLEKVKEILRCWKYCQLTLIGKITVRGIKWSLRAFASMRAVRLFLRARAVINFLMRAARTS